MNAIAPGNYSLSVFAVAASLRRSIRMKNIPQAMRNTLGLCAAAALLGGCGGSGQSPNPMAQAPLDRLRSDSSGNEVLNGKIHTHCKNHASGLRSTCTFRTTHPGKATGPYPGTFTATGSYGIDFAPYSRGFNESFTIISGSSEITGSISCASPPFGSGCPPNSYTSSVGNGTAQVNITNHQLSETLDEL